MKNIVLFLVVAMTVMTEANAKTDKNALLLRDIWNRPGSPTSKAKEARELNTSHFRRQEMMAYKSLLFQEFEESSKKAGPKQTGLDKDILIGIRAMGGFTKSMVAEMDRDYPGLLKWYRKKAGSRIINTSFVTEPSDPIRFEDLEQGDNEPDSAIPAIRWNTVKMQAELIKAGDLVIEDRMRRTKALYESLNESQKEIVRSKGYLEFWDEQQACYDHQHANADWACVCGQKRQNFVAIPDCAPKILDLNEKAEGIDEPTKILISLDHGDMAAVHRANDLKLNTPTAAKKNMINQLIYLHGGELGAYKVPESFTITLEAQFDAAEAGNSSYLTSIGLTREKIVELQEHYKCALNRKVADPKKYDTQVNQPSGQEAKDSADATKDNGSSTKQEDAIVVTDQGLMRTEMKQRENAKSSGPKPPRPADTANPATNPDGNFDLAAIAPKMQDKLKANLDLHRTLKGCVEVVPVTKNILEIRLTSCGLTSKGLFNIMETENPATKDFYDVCGNLAYRDILLPFKEEYGGQLHITVIGTADTIACITCNNDTLAYKRALGVVNFMAPELLEAIGGRDAVIIEPHTNDLERKVIIRIELVYPAKKTK